MKSQTILPYLIVGCFYAVVITPVVVLYLYCRWLFYAFVIPLVAWLFCWLLFIVCHHIAFEKPDNSDVTIEDEDLMYDHLILRRTYNSKTMRVIQQFAEKISDILEHFLSF